MSRVVVVTDGVQGPPGPGVLVRTTAEWESDDRVLGRGRLGYDETSGTLKIGDGSTVWSELPGISGEGSGGSAETNVLRVAVVVDDPDVLGGTFDSDEWKVAALSSLPTTGDLSLLAVIGTDPDDMSGASTGLFRHAGGGVFERVRTWDLSDAGRWLLAMSELAPGSGGMVVWLYVVGGSTLGYSYIHTPHTAGHMIEIDNGVVSLKKRRTIPTITAGLFEGNGIADCMELVPGDPAGVARPTVTAIDGVDLAAPRVAGVKNPLTASLSGFWEVFEVGAPGYLQPSDFAAPQPDVGDFYFERVSELNGQWTDDALFGSTPVHVGQGNVWGGRVVWTFNDGLDCNFAPSQVDVSEIYGLANIATSGDYEDLSGAPNLDRTFVHAVIDGNTFVNAGNPLDGTIPLATFNLESNKSVLVPQGIHQGVWLTQSDGTPWIWQGTPFIVMTYEQVYMKPNSGMFNVGESMWIHFGGSYSEAALGKQGDSSNGGLFEVDAVVQFFYDFIDFDGMTEEEYETAGIGLNQSVLMLSNTWSGINGIWRTPASYGQPLIQQASSRAIDWVVNKCTSKGRVSHSAGERNQRGDVWRRNEQNMFVRDFTYFKERVCVAVDAVSSTLADTDPRGGTLDPENFGVEDGDLVLFDKNYYNFGIWIAHDVGTPWEFYHSDQPSFARLKSDNSLYQNDTGVMDHNHYNATNNPFWKKVSDGPAPPVVDPLILDYTFTSPGTYNNGVSETTPVTSGEVFFARLGSAFKRVRVEIFGRFKGYMQNDWPDQTWTPGDVGYYNTVRQIGLSVNFERFSDYQWRLGSFSTSLGGYGTLPGFDGLQTDSSFYDETPTDPGFQRFVFNIEGDRVTAPGIGGPDRTWFTAQLTAEPSSIPGAETVVSYFAPATYEAGAGYVKVNGVGDSVYDPNAPTGISDITIHCEGFNYGGVLFEKGTRIKIYGYND